MLNNLLTGNPITFAPYPEQQKRSMTMKRELTKITIVAVAIYMSVCGFFLTVGMLFSVGISPRVLTVEKEKYVF